ncbi:MAG: hypothetical protein II143_05910 [Bacteroidales bacterium]|nr:hypothetical protein [Bacteroidales bacterium]
MMIKKAILGLLFIAAALFSTTGCIKDVTTYQYMKGKISFDIPEYIYTGDVVYLEADGITAPENPKWGWVITKIQTDTLYSPSIVVKFPDTPAEYVVKALAYHPDYIVESARKNVTTVDTTHMTGSLKGLPYDSQSTITDSRDRRAYRWAHIGSLDWFTENLAWEGAGYVYASSEVLNHVFGRHYTWEEATESDLCPEGWRLPDNADWEDLGKAICGSDVEFDKIWEDAASKVTPDAYFNGERLWPFSVNNTHDTAIDWNPLPCGYMQTGDGLFYGLKTYGMWWSATEYSGSEAYYRYIYWDSADFRPGFTSKSDIALSVRCVRGNL